MLNLLFISDSPKVEDIKNMLQPVLKVIVDVVTDFDHGLKDVFEKRPATVCIQDQIGGVTGESVARHIQLLLGTSAPKFILLHTGNDKARAIKGLYEHLIDLGQPNDAIADEIKSTLKSLLGERWERIYVPPKRTPASIRPSISLPEESREDADRLVDDFLSDLESSGFLVAAEPHAVRSTTDKVTKESSDSAQSETARRSEMVPGTVDSDKAQVINDDLAELLLIGVDDSKERRDENSVAASSVVKEGSGGAFTGSPTPATAGVKPPHPVIPEPLAPLALSKTPSDGTALAKPADSVSVKQEMRAAAAPVTRSQIPATPAAAEFRINQNSSPDEEQIPGDLLLAFEENYRSESLSVRRAVVIALVCAVCAAGGWYLVKQEPQLASSLKRLFLPSSVVKQVPVAVPAAIPVQEPVSAPVTQPAALPPLPAFIPQEGHDGSFVVKNPGWERYVGKLNEFRIFIASGRIQAVQVLAIKDAPISESLIKSVLQEFTGNSEYQITSRNTKAGIRVENGKIQNKGEIVLYKKNGAVKAFVVSVS